MVNKNNFVKLGLIRTFTMTNFAILLRWVYVCDIMHVCDIQHDYSNCFCLCAWIE